MGLWCCRIEKEKAGKMIQVPKADLIKGNGNPKGLCDFEAFANQNIFLVCLFSLQPTFFSFFLEMIHLLNRNTSGGHKDFHQ